MAGDWLTIVLRLALYLDITAAFGVTMFGICALRHDEPILDDLVPLSRTRWRICRHRHCAVNVGNDNHGQGFSRSRGASRPAR